MNNLTPRLKRIYDMTPQCQSCVDVGCDHGYLVCALLQNGKIQKGIASDISAPSLDKARVFAASQGLDITCICTDGLKDVPECDTVVIAGMGGILMTEILGECSWVAKKGKTALLQPMSHAHVLRNWLYQNGYEIVREQAVTEGKRVYTVMLVTFTGVVKEIPPIQQYLGSLVADFDDNAEAYAEKVRYRLQKQRDGKALQGEDTAEIDRLMYQIDLIL